MAQLTEEQKQVVAQWTASGASLNDVQDRLKQEFGITLTYLDARLLIMELGLKLQEKKQPEPEKKEEPAAPPVDAESDPDEIPYEDPGAGEPELVDGGAPEGAGGGGKVSVSLDAIMVPGTMVSGKATFSDGKTVGWYVDQMGRLGLRAPEPGYQPPPADIAAFQRELDRVLQQRGY